MKTLPAGLVASLATGGTLCTLVKLTLLTGRVIALADHDADVILGGITYASSFAFELSSVAIHSGTQNSSLELSALLDLSVFDRNDILSGTLDRAKCEIFVCDYAQPNNGAGLYYAGRVHQISFSSDITAILQINSLLDQNVQAAYEQFSYICTADLGDARCKVDIAGRSKIFIIAADVALGQAFFTDLVDADGFWNAGLVKFTSGLNEGFAVEVGQYSEANGAIVMKLPFPYALTAGDTGIVYPGCDKTPTTCLNTYNNILNYRGIPIGIDPSLGTGATTLDGGSGGFALDQQPPNKIGVYNTFDKSFGWYSPDQLPPLPNAKQLPSGFVLNPSDETLQWSANPVVTFPKRPMPYGSTPFYRGGNVIYYSPVEYRPAPGVYGSEIPITYDQAVGSSGATYAQYVYDYNPCDNATAYGSKFEFNGLVYTFAPNNFIPAGGVNQGSA